MFRLHYIFSGKHLCANEHRLPRRIPRIAERIASNKHKCITLGCGNGVVTIFMDIDFAYRNGLLGAADGAFLLTKGNRCSTSTFLHVTGRDQADQIMQLRFSRENYLWKLEGYVNEMEGDSEQIPPDPLLERISEIVSDKGWCGNASSLHEIIGNDDYQPNTLVRKLNISVDRLYHEYGIRYENRHTRQGSRIRLSKVS